MNRAAGNECNAVQADGERLRRPTLTTGLFAEEASNSAKRKATLMDEKQVATHLTSRRLQEKFSCPRTLPMFSATRPLIQYISSSVLKPKTVKEGKGNTSNERNSQLENDNHKYLPQKPLNIAVMNRTMETVLELLNLGANPEEKDGYYGNTGIHWAVRANNIEVLEIYRERGLNFSVTNNINWYPIHLAAESSQHNSLVWLLKNGADIESEDSYKQTPLYIAAFKGNFNAAKLLLSYGASPNCKDIKSYTPLFVAAINGDLEMVKLLYKHGADLKHTESWGRSLLHVAKTSPLLEWLIEHNVDINRKDDWGRTPLHDAVQASRLQNAALLLAKGADIEAQDRNGCTPLYEAAKSGKTEFVRLFLGNGADPESIAKDGSTPAEVAVDKEIKYLLSLKKESVKYGQKRQH